MGTDDNKNDNHKLSYSKLNENNNNNNNSCSNNNKIYTLNDLNNNDNHNDKNYTEIDIDNSNNNQNNIQSNNILNKTSNLFKSIFKSKPKRIIINGVLIDQRSKEERMTLKNERFPDKPQYKDIMFSILFFIQMALFFVLLGISIKEYPGKKIIFEFMEQGIISILISLPLMLIFYIIWKRIFKIHPVNMIKTSFFFLLVIYLLCIALLIGNEYYGCAVALFICKFCTIYFYVIHKDKIPFAAQVITVTLSIIEMYPSSIASSFISLIITTIYYNIWLFTTSYYMTFSSSTFDFIKIIFLFFNLYWTHYLLTYIMYSTISGLFASWYFFANEEFTNMPQNPSLSSFRRAITTSFGSIALGSLIVCVISTIELIIRIMVNISCIRYLLANSLCCFNIILKRFNIYSFSMVAIYGESYCHSSKKTFNLLLNNPVKLTVAHNFFYITTLAISISMSFIIAFIVIMIMSSININEEWFNFQMLMFLFIFWKPFDVVFSGVITIVMCLVSEPQIIQNNKPSLYHSLNQIYDFN